MSRRLAAAAALAVVLGCAGCDAVDSGRDAAAAAGDQLKAEATKQLDAQLDHAKAEAKSEATAAAKRRAAELAAQAHKAVQQQVASGTTAAKAAAGKAVHAVASAVPAAGVPAVSVPSVAPAPSVHTITGTFAPAESFDLSGGSVPCATAANVVGQVVRVDAGTAAVTGALTACTWSTPTVSGVSPVFTFVVQNVPAAAAYDISIGDRAWKVSGTTLAASGWALSLT